ncbi:nucleotidyltransferase family protein [Clostridium sp.]|uniref:nucleotidyltransferase domain-containing protein n=1 Tax=Clostridium sp. TaxID=1506 RepID=UPI0032170C86
MNNTQKQFVDLLSGGIRGAKVFNTYENVNWEEILELAKAHKVEGIIYSALSKGGLTDKLEEGKLKELKMITFRTGIGQLRSINNLLDVFNKFNDNNINVIVLKGLVIREFYPQPEQRSMCDADILIHIEDLERTKELLVGIGYILDDHEASHHIKFLHPSYPVIEIHWHLFKRDGFSKELEKFERLIWKEAVKVYIGKSQVLSLGYEDLALHLCMHMAAHLASTGFGLRQLCDLVLLVENKGQEINWDSFIIKARMYGFEKFSLIMFIICNKLFNMNIPKELNVSTIRNKRHVESLVDEIFESGVHGKSDMTSRFGNQVAFNFGDKDSNATLGAVKRYLAFIFPSADNLSDRYSYAKKAKVFLPIAWVHHLFVGVFRSEYGLGDKFRFLTTGASVSIKRNKLLEWMEL